MLLICRYHCLCARVGSKASGIVHTFYFFSIYGVLCLFRLIPGCVLSICLSNSSIYQNLVTIIHYRCFIWLKPELIAYHFKIINSNSLEVTKINKLSYLTHKNVLTILRNNQKTQKLSGISDH